MFRPLEYQDRVLKTLDDYISELIVYKRGYEQVELLRRENPNVPIPTSDFCHKTWNSIRNKKMLPISRGSIPYSPRTDGCGRPVPNVVFKVPTAGGKTWLAIKGISRVMDQYCRKNFGLVLWIVPSEAIYTQTLKCLHDRRHPYRQELDLAACGNVQILEKNDSLKFNDLNENLCVMLVMLQSANQETKESLRIFQDRGNIHGFFPSEGNQQSHKRILEQIPNLDHYQGDFPIIKDSLGNALRRVRPIVVVDEGHRAMSDLAVETLYGFNPSFVLELTATPKDSKSKKPNNGNPTSRQRFANVLLEVSGRELDKEGMIKMPINLNPRQGTDWQATLNAALETLEELNREAETLHANTNRYIRPILIIQVERTGKDHRDNEFIHSDDVRDWLVKMGFDEAEIATKTAERNDLNQPENQDLLSPINRVRVIITKQALQEGWDCPFAYVLCSLAASRNQNALTQLIGRILRQPDAQRTGNPRLDECYVITHHTETHLVARAIKSGLERDGLGDLELKISIEDKNFVRHVLRSNPRRPEFADSDINLPRVLYVNEKEIRELDYQTDVLAHINWHDFDPRSIADQLPLNAQEANNQLQRIKLSEQGSEWYEQEDAGGSEEELSFDAAHTTRILQDIVPNPFVGRELVEKLSSRLYSRGFTEKMVGGLSRLIIDELRRGLIAERDRRAEMVFRKGVENQTIQFRLRTDGENWVMPHKHETIQPEDAAILANSQGRSIEKSLFASVYENDLNADEREIAVYLDEEKALSWWHRNAVGSHYGIQGWRQNKIYPDFIFSIRTKAGVERITVIETKGDYLSNSIDTSYKKNLLTFLSQNFSWNECNPAGKIELVQPNGAVIRCALILMSEWKTELPRLLTHI